jgi:hypothetical protein
VAPGPPLPKSRCDVERIYPVLGLPLSTFGMFGSDRSTTVVTRSRGSIEGQLARRHARKGVVKVARNGPDRRPSRPTTHDIQVALCTTFPRSSNSSYFVGLPRAMIRLPCCSFVIFINWSDRFYLLLLHHIAGHRRITIQWLVILFLSGDAVS